MSARSVRSLQVFYISFIAVVFTALVAGSWWFWEQGPSRSSKVAEVFEAAAVLDRLMDPKAINEIDAMVASDRVRAAAKYIINLDSDAQILENIVSPKMSDKRKETSSKLRTQMHRLIEYPELSSIFMVLANKMSAFENFVVQNEWRTLTRLSKRANARLEPAKLRSPGYFAYDRLQQTVGGIREDLKQMQQVTEGSVLSSTDKNAIITNLRTMDGEIEMLNNYVVAYKNFVPVFASFKSVWIDWLAEISPALAKKRLEQEQATTKILYGVLGLISFLLLGAVIGFFIYRREKNKASKEWERQSIHLLRDHLLVTNTNENPQWSRDFILEFNKYREYVHKRMSFGSIFQEATPFGAFLLDSNLGVVWGNDLFWSCWNLDKPQDTETKISWDYLQSFTNLGEDDPVMMALKEGIAGIYQIQIKNSSDSESLPYEMYVSPVDYADQKRIMIFLYPLRSMEESLQQQSKAIIGPVVKTLDAIMAGEFEGANYERLRTQFNIAGIDSTFENFERFNASYTDRLGALEEEITHLRKNLENARTLIMETYQGTRDAIERLDRSITSFEQVKSNVINVIDQRYELERRLSDNQQLEQQLLGTNENLLASAQQVQTLLSENLKGMETVARVREEFKRIKEQIDEKRSILNQNVDQLLVQAKREGTQVEGALHKIKNDIKTFDQTQAQLHQSLITLDVTLSKMEMVLETQENPDLEQVKVFIEQLRNEMDATTQEVHDLKSNGESLDESVVAAMGQLYSDFQRSRSLLIGMRRILSNKETESSVSLNQ